MTRLKALSDDEATGKTKELFNAIGIKLGVVPNMMRAMGNSSALLEGSLNLSAALSGGKLGAKMAELIALAVAESNSCDYCLSAHTFIGSELLKIDTATIAAARKGYSQDARTDAVLKFSKLLVDKKGLANEVELNALESAGISEAEVGEIIGHVALNILTNYFNNMAKPEIDFPLVEPYQVAVF